MCVQLMCSYTESFYSVSDLLAKAKMAKVFFVYNKSMFKFLFFYCVCVVGNMVEFCLPHDIDLDGVEFKSMASGSHRITNDFMYVFPHLFSDRQMSVTLHQSIPHPSGFASSSARYFRKGCYFGLACFANMPVESELERGARMKSVGILCPSYTLLYRYMHFLENQVRSDMSSVYICLF